MEAEKTAPASHQDKEGITVKRYKTSATYPVVIPGPLPTKTEWKWFH